MKFLIVALPLFNKDMHVEAYKMYMRDGDKLIGTSQGYTLLDGAMNSQALEVLNKTGLEPFTGGCPIFIPVNKFILLTDLKEKCQIAYESVVLSIGADVIETEAYVQICTQLKQDGFKIALENVPYSRNSRPYFRIADYVIIDSSSKSRMDEIRYIFYDCPRIRIVLKGILTKAQFEFYKNVSKALYEGSFYNEPITSGVTSVNPLKTNLLHLLKIANDEDFELGDVAKIIQRDASLTISLLRFINSPAVGSKHKISSIQNAVAFLGQNEVRKWITIAVSTKLSEDKPNELTKLSLTRAKFAENLAGYFEMGIHAQSLFLVGLFSLLDVVIEMPMEKAVKEISLSDSLVEVLVSNKGPFAPVLDLIKSYEHGDWEKVAYILILNNMKATNVSDAFIDSLIWYKNLLEDIS